MIGLVKTQHTLPVERDHPTWGVTDQIDKNLKYIVKGEGRQEIECMKVSVGSTAVGNGFTQFSSYHSVVAVHNS